MTVNQVFGWLGCLSKLSMIHIYWWVWRNRVKLKLLYLFELPKPISVQIMTVNQVLDWQDCLSKLSMIHIYWRVWRNRVKLKLLYLFELPKPISLQIMTVNQVLGWQNCLSKLSMIHTYWRVWRKKRLDCSLVTVVASDWAVTSLPWEVSLLITVKEQIGMAAPNFTGDGQQKTLEDLFCSPDLSAGLHFGCNKRGQTSRPGVGTEIQTSCNFKANLRDCYCLLNSVHCLFSSVVLESRDNLVVWYHSNISVSGNRGIFLHRDFLKPPSSSQSSTKSCSTSEPNKSN